MTINQFLKQPRALTLKELNALTSSDWGFAWNCLLNQVIKEKEALGE